ncbi:MAG: relaxase/mobilization nuclease domain-containing protein [Clostridia bacterium]|nr:relaxase/mobilization nuclease domain-containing protein [Clostridia bacterium]
MHKQVVFITRLLNPNKTSTIARNKTYLSYISQKENVFRNEQTEHGLFGYIRDIPDIETNNSISEVQKYINKISNEKKNIYRSIISLSEADAIEKGFDKKEAWSDLIKTKLPEFAKKLNIPYNNLEYVVSIHRDKGHPHAHIMFWDREQQVQKNFIHKKLSNNFRISLNKYIFNEEYTELLKQRDTIKENFISSEKDIEKQLLSELEGKNTKDIGDNDFIYSSTMFMDRISKEEIKDIMKDVFELRKELPKTRKHQLQVFIEIS